MNILGIHDGHKTSVVLLVYGHVYLVHNKVHSEFGQKTEGCRHTGGSR
jgi:hypothetical protein